MAEHSSNRTYDLPPGSPFSNHGKTPASWVLFLGAIVSGLAAALAVMFWQLWLVIVAVVILVVSLLASHVMRGMGMGQPHSSPHHRSTSDDWYA